jgi:hypothetical protein
LGNLSLIRKELGLAFVGIIVEREKGQRRDHPVRPVGSLLAVSLCLAVGLVFVSAGTALGISGFDSNQPAVRAQYPDTAGLQPRGPKPVISSLRDVISVTRKIERDPKAAARFRAVQNAVSHKLGAAMSSAPALDTRQTGSIALLIVGIAVLAVGGFLRWRRGLTQIE